MIRALESKNGTSSPFGSFYLCVDWGTTTLRVILYDNSFDGKVIDIEKGNLGVFSVNNLWLKADKLVREKGRVDFYLSFLKEFINPIIHRNKLSFNIPLIISGMASSSIGIKDINYIDMPFSINEKSLDISYAIKNSVFKSLVLLITGLKNNLEVMRGEEVQVIGLIEHLKKMKNLDSDDTLILIPGTHSKHIHIKGECIINMGTYMTGEVYDLLCSYGLLNDSVNRVQKPLTANQWSAFSNGLSYSGTATLLNSIFRVRTNQILGDISKEDNAVFLSGLLIGYELRDIKLEKYKKIALYTSHKLFNYYKNALEFLYPHELIIYINPDEMELNTAKGQLIIAEAYLNKKKNNEEIESI